MARWKLRIARDAITGRGIGEHSQARLEGLLEGLREAITGRIAAS